MRRLGALLLTAVSLFLLLLGTGQLMIRPPNLSLVWTWLYIAAGLGLIPFWWRELKQEDQEIDRSLQAGDVQVTDRELVDQPNGLLAVLQQFARHMQMVHGMEVRVETRGRATVEEEGQRVLLFEVVEDLLLYMARRGRVAVTRVVLDRQPGYNVVHLEPEGAVDLRATAGYDLLKHLEERLYQVEGQLRVEPDAAGARRITLMAAVEGVRAPDRMVHQPVG